MLTHLDLYDKMCNRQKFNASHIYLLKLQTTRPENPDVLFCNIESVGSALCLLQDVYR